MKKISIALDGPSGAGKSSVAKAVAKRLGILYLDTGALYRTVGLHVKNCGVDPHDAAAVEATLASADIDARLEDGAQQNYLNGVNVGDTIRTPEMSMYASAVSAIPAVRAFLLDMQRSIAHRSSVIMDGRDIGSVVLPDADVKIYLSASAEIRAERRYRELVGKGQQVRYEDVLSDMRQRDKNDAERDISPLCMAADAILLDSGHLTLEETIDRALEIIEENTGN